MCKILPQYLSNIATNINLNKDTIIFNINCTCGNQSFFIFKNDETIDDIKKKQRWDDLIKKYDGGGYSDSDGNLFLTKKLFGLKTKQIKINKSEIPQYTTILKVKCSKCGKEYMIFDSRSNGYNAISEKLSDNKTNDSSFSYKKFLDKEQIIKIKIINDLSYHEFIDEFKNASMKDFSNAFSEISIYITHNNKNKCIFTTETR